MDEFRWRTAWALLRIAVCLAVVVAGSRRRLPLELSLTAAGGLAALLSGLSLREWGGIVLQTLGSEELWAMLCAVTGILVLSGLMDKSGQSRRLVAGVERVVGSVRIRLVLFPALLGLLPMPGGAVFSCPMVQETARGSAFSGVDKSLINYWFRHVWELIWPLYPGLVLYCGLAEIGPLDALRLNWPMWAASLIAGWALLLRRLPAGSTGIDESAEAACENPSNAARVSLLREALPLLAGLGGAFALRAAVPNLASGFAFGPAFGVGALICLMLNRCSPAEACTATFTRRNFGILLLVAAVFVFKNLLGPSGIMDDLGGLARSSVTLMLACTLLPLLAGLLTGLLTALVGIAFPLLTALLHQADLWADRLPWLTLALMFGHIGQMLSPVHVCLVATCRFFEVGPGGVMRRLILPCLILACAATVWFGVLTVPG